MISTSQRDTKNKHERKGDVIMEFKKMRDRLMEHFAEMTKDASHLYEVSLDKDKLWELYLDSFPAGTNEIFRERAEHDCSICRHFIKSIGNVVVIKDKEIITIWDFDTESEKYQPVMDAMAAFVKAHAVSDVFVTKFKNFGTLKNYEETVDGNIIEWTHFYLDMSGRFVDRSSQTVEAIQAVYRDSNAMFQSALDTISEDALLSVLDLIVSNTLYKGAEWERQIREILKHKKAYEKLAKDSDRTLYTWEHSVKLDGAVTRIKNTAIGTLLVNITEGMDLDTAVRKYEQIVAPSNYKRSKPVFTPKMLEEAKKKIQELGYMESLGRRFAKLDDITVNNILFSNRDSAKRIEGGMDVFGEMMKAASVSPKKFSRVEEMSIEKFIEDVLPTVRELELYFENKHAGNMVSLIAPVAKDSKTMFKWKNNFSWAYAGNVTDSMKERVKAAGGKVDGDLRFSIQWNENGRDNSDLDAHCVEADGNEIYFGNCRKPRFSHSGGQLDVDIISPGGKVAVENITWADRKKMRPGVYRFFVHQFSGSIQSFKAEIEFDGQIYAFEYNLPLSSGQKVQIAEVTLDYKGNFTIEEKLNSSVSSREIWNMKTNDFVPVSVVMYSPNYWDEQQGIGHKHVFFMLKGCISEENPNGFYNEFLNQELAEHRKVMEAMGGKLRVQDCEDQLSGVGFSTTKRDEVIVKVKGNTERIIKIKF